MFHGFVSGEVESPSSGDQTPSSRSRKRKNAVEDAILSFVRQQEPEDEETLFGTKRFSLLNISVRIK